MGANTYVGNAPNFMVKSISDENGIRMPSFFGYMGWSLCILVPVLDVYKRQREGSEREPETLCLQAVGHLYMMNRVLFVERSGELRMPARLST